MLLQVLIILFCFYLLNKYLILIMRYMISDVLNRNLKYGIIGMIKADIYALCDCIYFYEFIIKALFYTIDILLSPIIFLYLFIQLIKLNHLIHNTDDAELKKDIYNNFNSEDLDRILDGTEDL